MGYVFVTLDFPGCCDNVTVDPKRRKVTEIARRWSGLLASTGMDAAAQVWKDNQLAFETKHENHVKEITDYCMMQPETAMVRWNMENTYGPAATPEWIAAYEKSVADREAAKAEKIRKNKAEAARKKKKEEAKQAKAERKRKKNEAKAEADGDKEVKDEV